MFEAATSCVTDPIEFSLNVFTDFAELSDKNICYYSKRAQMCHPATSYTRNQVRERIFKLSPIHASMIYQIPWIQWIPVPFRENSNKTQVTEIIFKLTRIHASVIYQIPWFSVPFRENSNEIKRMARLINWVRKLSDSADICQQYQSRFS